MKQESNTKFNKGKNEHLMIFLEKLQQTTKF